MSGSKRWSTKASLWQAHDPIAAALHANAANVEAVMIAGQWRKRDHQLVGIDLANVEEELRESGSRLAGEMESRFRQAL